MIIDTYIFEEFFSQFCGENVCKINILLETSVEAFLLSSELSKDFLNDAPHYLF